MNTSPTRRSHPPVCGAWRGLLTAGLAFSLSLAGLSAVQAAEATSYPVESQQSGHSLPEPVPTQSTPAGDPEPAEQPTSSEEPAEPAIPGSANTDDYAPAVASLATSEDYAGADPAATIKVLDLSNSNRPLKDVTVYGQTTINGIDYEFGPVTTDANGLADFFVSDFDDPLSVTFSVWLPDVGELSRFTLILEPGVTATKTVGIRSKPIVTKVTFKVIDENKWALSGIEARSSGYSGDYDSLSAAGKTNTTGKVTLTYKLYGDVSKLTINLQDSYLVVPGKALTVKSLKAGETRDLGTVKLRAHAKTGKSSKAIKTSSKSAVNKAYRTRLVAKTRYEKPISSNGCKPKTTPSAQQKRELSAVNFYRGMVGVQPVKLDSSLSKKATAAALIQYKNGYLSHYPGKTKKNCWTKTGYEASRSSNLALGVIGASAVSAYVEDFGANNKEVGHRRWIMDPALTKIGTGSVGYANALYVVAPGSEKQPRPNWIAWPSAGYFPVQEEPGGRWSFMSTRADVNFSKAKVTVKVGKTKLKTSVISRDKALKPMSGTWNMGGQWGMVFNVKKLPKVSGSKVVNAKVTISNLTLRNGTKLKDYTYTVKFFNAK